MSVQFSRNIAGIKLLSGGTEIFGTDALPAALMPEAAITLSSYTLTWTGSSAFSKDNAYYHQTVTGTDPITHVPFQNETCAAYITSVPGEYIVDTDLGIAPSGSDYLDVQINFKTRPTVPNAILGDALDLTFPLNAGLCPLGASIIIWEAALHVRYLMFFIRAADNHIIMRRGTSVSNADGSGLPWQSSPSATGMTPGSVHGNLIHFNSGGTVSSPSFGTDGYERGQSGQISTFSLTDSTSYDEAFVIDAVITPGYFRTDPTIVPPKGYCSDSYSTPVSATSFSFSAKIGEADSTRLVAVGITGANFSTGANGIATCTIGGVTATKIKETLTSSGFIASIWAAQVPTGTTATVAFTAASTGIHYVGVAVFVMYGVSSTPVGTASTTANITVASLTVVANGYAIGVATFDFPGFNQFFGLPFGTFTLLSGTNFDVGAEITTSAGTVGLEMSFSGSGCIAGASWG